MAYRRPVPKKVNPRRARAVRARRRKKQDFIRKALFGLAGVLAIVSIAVVLLSTLPGIRAAGEQTASQAGTVSSEKRIVVAIDPGHGGGDVGAEGGGCYEADLTRKTADFLAQLLEQDGRFEPVYTTDGTEYRKGSQRGETARQAEARLLLSIHFNSDPVYGSSGFECYPAVPALETNAESLRFARLLTEEFSGAGSTLRGVDGIRYLYYDENDEKQIFESTDTTPRSWPTFTVLEACGCPAVLAEQCFITNEADLAAFGSEAGCQKAAELYYRAICAYFS